MSAFLPSEWNFWAAKSLHITGYALLAFLAVTLPVPRRWKWYLVGFLALHGASVVLPWQLRRNQDPAGVRLLLFLSISTVRFAYGFLVAAVVTGVLAGLAGHWWGQRWIWAALVLVIVMMGVMGAMSRGYHEARQAGGAVARPNPVGFTVVGAGGLLILLWLMVLKPF